MSIKNLININCINNKIDEINKNKYLIILKRLLILLYMILKI